MLYLRVLFGYMDNTPGNGRLDKRQTATSDNQMQADAECGWLVRAITRNLVVAIGAPAAYDQDMRLVPQPYLRFRDRFPRVVRWILDLVVFVVALNVVGVVLSFLLVAQERG